MISKKTKYALKALEHLALHSNGHPILIADLASAEQIPKKFLEYILLALRKGGVLTSRIGKGGGYWLAHDPADITIGRVVRILDGDFSLVHCLQESGPGRCENGKDPSCCGIHYVMADMKSSITSVFETVTLADIVNRRHMALQDKADVFDYCI